MKKILLLLIIFSSCKKEVYYYPSEDFFIENNPTEINIDDLNFEKVTDSIREGQYLKKYSFIKIKDSKTIYKISPFAVTGGLVKMRNTLYIRNDSIDLIKGVFPISDLSKYLKLHYENNGKDYFFASSYRSAHIRVVLSKEEKSKKLKQILLKLVKTYNQTEIENKDSISFNIVFDYPIKHPQYIPPPPIKFKNE